MWYIQLLAERLHFASPDDFASIQLLEKQADIIYNSIPEKYGARHCEDYKILNIALENHIMHHINNIPTHKIDLYIYNYGIDNAIVLLNNYNNNTKKYINTTAKSMLFAIYYSMFVIVYVTDTSSNTIDYASAASAASAASTASAAIVIIQRFWRKILAYRKKLKTETIHKDFDFLIDKINKEITGEPAKRVLNYLVNKFRRRLGRRLSL
jgi:hypothetical protein